MSSPNNTTITDNGGTIVDAANNTWALDNAQVAVNGVVDPTTADVIEMAYVNGRVWQENARYLWYAKPMPAAAWSPADGTPVSPLPASPYPVSANNVVAVAPGQTIVDANHNTWSISSGRQVVTNGAVDPNTGGVAELAYEGGQVWQEIGAGLWWAKNSPDGAWLPASGTPVSPIPSGTPPTAAPYATRAWLGGPDDAAADPNDWSPTGTPRPGDVILVAGGATLNVAGNTLAGDTVTQSAGGAAPVTINASANAQLTLSGLPPGLLDVDLNVADTVALGVNMYHGQLAASGGTIQFIGSDALNGSARFDDALTGNATISLNGGQGEGASVELGGAVGPGLTFSLAAVAPVLTLRIDQPALFGGVLNIAEDGAGFGSVVLAGLTATSGTLSAGTLDLFNGSQLVDGIRLTGLTGNLTLDQTAGGVALSQHHVNASVVGASTVIPLGQLG